ncbi:MAG TPA: TonB-dependent receptor [Steroidobacter sp.]|nr:TonB-dependent receptor [Steroidobacter sp.]
MRAAVAAVAHVVHCNEACASTEDHRQFSQELQIVSPQGRSFEWLLGVYYFDETNHVRNEYEFPFVQDMFGLPIPCCKLRLNGRATTEASAVFGEANYDFTDKVNLVVGGRYSRERRGGYNDVEFVNFLTPLMDNQSPFEPETFTSFTPKVGLNFQVSDVSFAYLSASRGFKSGGFNIGSYQNTPFSPEKIWSYEAGLKTDLLQQRLRGVRSGSSWSRSCRRPPPARSEKTYSERGYGAGGMEQPTDTLVFLPRHASLHRKHNRRPRPLSEVLRSITTKSAVAAR